MMRRSSTIGWTDVLAWTPGHGLVCREACPSDRRSSYAVITAGGRKRMDEVLPGHLALIDEWFTGQLDPEQLDALLTALRKVRDAVRPYAAVGGVPPVCAARPLSSGG